MPADHLPDDNNTVAAAMTDAAVDALLRADLADAVSAARPLPPALRARIVAATERAREREGERHAAPTLRPSIWDVALRVAAVAAVIATTLWISPAAANAAESVLSVRPTIWAPVEFPVLDGARAVLDISPATGLDLGAGALPLALAAGALLGAGLLLRRR